MIGACSSQVVGLTAPPVKPGTDSEMFAPVSPARDNMTDRAAAGHPRAIRSDGCPERIWVSTQHSCEAKTYRSLRRDSNQLRTEVRKTHNHRLAISRRLRRGADARVVDVGHASRATTRWCYGQPERLERIGEKLVHVARRLQPCGRRGHRAGGHIFRPSRCSSTVHADSAD